MITTYKHHFAKALEPIIKLSFEEILETIEIPPENIGGDFGFPCFGLAKTRKKSPIQIAEEIAKKVQSPFFEEIKAIGPYVNGYIKKNIFIKDVCEHSGESAANRENQSTKVLIEYMGANPNKPLHIGHVRNVCIGDTLRRIYKYLGYNITASTYGDDSGVNVGYNIVGHMHYGIPLETEKKFDHYCGEIYTQMKAKDEDPEFKKLLSETLLKIEEGKDQEIYKIHQEYTKRCAIEQLKTCWRMNASFDMINRETDILHMKFFAEAIDLLKEKGYVKYVDEGEAAGCRIIDLSSIPEYEKEEKQYQILIKSDGVATYVAKDIAFALRKLGYLTKDFLYKTFAHEPDGNIIYTTSGETSAEHKDKFGNYNQAITIIDNRQIHPQEVVKSSLRLLGYLGKNKNYEPLGYGVVYVTPNTLIHFKYELSEEEKAEKRLPFASRKGWTITVDEMLNLLHEKAYRETKERNPEKDAERLDDVAEKIAIGSLRFFLIKSDISRDIVFDIEEALDMQGESGAYILYTGARIQSILDNEEAIFEHKSPEEMANALDLPEEMTLIKHIAERNSVILETKEQEAPHILCRYLLEMARSINNYYAHVKILKSPEPIKSARLQLLKKCGEYLKQGLQLIGVESVERM